jgi:hypothetical protein
MRLRAVLDDALHPRRVYEHAKMVVFYEQDIFIASGSY